MPQAQETAKQQTAQWYWILSEHLPPPTSCETLHVPLAHLIFIRMGNPCSMPLYTHTHLHTDIHTNSHPAAGIFYDLFRCFKQFWNTMIVIKHGKHPPTLSINAAEPPKRNLNESCYFNYFSKAFYSDVNTCHYSRILYKKRRKLWKGMKS